MLAEAAALHLAGCKGSEEAPAVRTLVAAENLKSTDAPGVNARSLRPWPGGPAGAGRPVGTASGPGGSPAPPSQKKEGNGSGTERHLGREPRHAGQSLFF